MHDKASQFWIDVGGTFTDCFLRQADGTLRRKKLLSSGVTRSVVGTGSTATVIIDSERSGDPEGFWTGFSVRLLDSAGAVVDENRVLKFDPNEGRLELTQAFKVPPALGQRYELQSAEEAPLLAIRYLLGLRPQDRFPKISVRLGTTRGTNALLTREGARTALVTTKGFADLLNIGNQNRPRLFELNIRKPTPLTSAVLEIDERLSATGEVLTVPDEKQVQQELQELRSQGIESLAICLLHAYRNEVHEQWLLPLAEAAGFDEISLSSQAAPLMKIVSRAETTVVDAYLNPVLRDYIAKLRDALGENELRILTSAGGLNRADRFSGKDSILSGPAGGVVGFSRVAQSAGFQRAIGFDMGGTSTDVSRFDGRYLLEYETEKAGVRIVAPMLKIETVAAGGGSICHFDGVKLAVGPESAGAAPGPACYGSGGPLAVTDLNVFLGRIPPERFPFPLDLQAVERRLQKLAEEIQETTGTKYESVALAEGLLQIANTNMAAAIRTISVAEGVDQREYVLVSFGGAAPQHACAVAKELGMVKILNHPDSGILSAYGIGLADVVRHGSSGVYQPYRPQEIANLEPVFTGLESDLRQELLSESVPESQISFQRSLDLRYQGVDAALNIPLPADGDYVAAFEAEHQQLFGYLHPARKLEIVVARVEATGRCSTELPVSQRVERKATDADSVSQLISHSSVTSWINGVACQVSVFERASLSPGDVIVGPAIVAEELSTTVIDPDWKAEMLSGGELLIEYTTDAASPSQVSQSPADENDATYETADPVLLEIFNNQFAAIAAQMGSTLQNTASSVNVKERLDFSCAIFTAEGDLVVNAPHIPVHLGAMGQTVRAILADNPSISPGDVFVTNDPYRGGSHLPDITVITPVHDAASAELLFFTASRAHHAEIGGIRPGSVPPDSRTLAEEGVLIQNFKFVSAGESREDALREMLLSGPYPTRNVNDNLADLAAQVAANQQGVRDLLSLVQQRGWPMVSAYMRHIQAAASTKMRMALARLPNGCQRYEDHLDDGSPIAVAITIQGEQAVIDFTGTGPVVANNLNANRAIVTAATMYSLRLLIDEDIPLNQGVLEPIELILPECLLNPSPGKTPAESPAVVGGNTETSQRVVDVLLGALGLAAASQGTMNNLTFGDGKFGYYETICGGSGATSSAPGVDAVHTHMTNTRLTDPEVLESRFPVRLREFSIRQGSGGAGEHAGGCGVIRKMEFLTPLQVSLLMSRRGPYPPYGLQGGEPGKLGKNTLEYVDGSKEQLAGRTQFDAQPGDILTIKTPGGGGYGKPTQQPK